MVVKAGTAGHRAALFAVIRRQAGRQRADGSLSRWSSDVNLRWTAMGSPCRRQSTSSTASGKTSAATQMDLGRHFYLNKVLEQYAAKPATRMTLRQLVFFGRTLGRDRDKILKSANYVRQELAVRIAHRIRDLQALPFVVMTNPHLEEVYEKYWNAFETFRKIPMIRTMEDNEEFCLTLKRLLDDHLTIIPSLTIGVVESSHHLPPDQLDAFMERMLRSRISRRVLAEQHIALSDALDDPFHFFNDGTSIPDTPSSHDGDHIGIIYTNLKVSSVVSKVVRLLTNVFQDEVRAGYRVGDASVIPEVVIDGALDTRFAYIPEHLEYIFFELLKNSMMAVMRQPLSARDPVTIRVTIVEGPPDEDLIVRVSDCGGGLPDLLTKLNTQNARREHRRKHQHRSVSRRRKEVLDDESASVAHHGQSSRHGRQRQPHSSASSEGQLDPQVMMDSTLAEDQSSSIAAAMEADHARGEIDIAMSSAKHAVPPVTREGTAVSGASANRAGSTDPLIAAVTSFSNVRRRLEIEDEELRRSVTSQHDADQSSDTSTPADAQPNRASAESPGREKEALGMGLRASVGGERGTGIDSRAKLDALRNVGRFKGTVAEQLATHDAQQRQSGAQEAEELADAVALTLGGDLRSTLARQETGLGLPMTKIYTDFFGGSLNLRSLDGHGMDVYVRLPKLGTNKEAIEEIVL